MKRTKDLRSRNTFFLPRVNLEKIRKLPPYKFPNTWNENKHLLPEDSFSPKPFKLMLTNLINEYYEKKALFIKRLNVFIPETIKSKTTTQKLKKKNEKNCRINKTQGKTKVYTNKKHVKNARYF